MFHHLYLYMALLTDDQIKSFIEDGYVRIQGAFSPQQAERCRAELWQRLIDEHPELDPDDPTTWTIEHERLPISTAAPLVDAANTPVLYEAFDDLVGKGGWKELDHVGAFPVRFPSAPNKKKPPEKAGMHIDGSIAIPKRPFANGTWGINLDPHRRALNVLFLYSDTTPTDGATMLLAGSHLDVVPILAKRGNRPINVEAIPKKLRWGKYRVDYVTGNAGDVFLVHPLLLHCGTRNTGKHPKFLGQPGLQGQERTTPAGNGELTPLETAMQMGLGRPTPNRTVRPAQPVLTPR